MLSEIVEWVDSDKASAIGTVLAAVVALGVAANEGRRRRLDKEDTAAAQARIVTVQRHPQGFRITNHSADSPILSLKVAKVEVLEDGTPNWEAGIGDVTEDGSHVEVLAPGDSHLFTVRDFRRPGSTEVNLQRRLHSEDKLRCTFAFTDAQGLRWKRVHQRQPERVLDGRTGWRRVLFWR